MLMHRIFREANPNAASSWFQDLEITITRLRLSVSSVSNSTDTLF
jgi:hypothetical protein